MTSHYFRQPILSFYDLNEIQQKNVVEDPSYEGYNPHEDSFVLESENSENPISLSMFMRIDRKGSMWNGYYTTTNTSAYVIKIGRDGEDCIVAAKYW